MPTAGLKPTVSAKASAQPRLRQRGHWDRQAFYFNAIHFHLSCKLQGGPGSSVGIATELRAGRSGDRIPVGGEIFHTCPDRPWGPPSLLYNGYRVFPGGKERTGRDVETRHPLLVPLAMKE